MDFIKFSKEHIIGVKEIDDQHREIYKTVNKLHKIRKENKPEVLKTFESLISQFKTHFAAEEDFMKRHKVVQFISHKLEHERAFAKYSDYYKKLKRSKAGLDPEILDSIKNWLISHNEKKDSKLADIVPKN